MLANAPAQAHQFVPALLELQEVAENQVNVRWKEPLLRVMGSQLQPLLPVECGQLDEPVVRQENSGRVSKWAIRCEKGLVGKTIQVSNIQSSGANVLLRIKYLDGHTFRQILTPGASSVTVPQKESWISVFLAYVKLGIEHILTGADHLLFVLGLTLLVTEPRRLLFTVTAFTLGHSVTLCLAILGWIHFPSGPIEAGIAFSIYILAVELTSPYKNNFLSRYPWYMAGLFGLLHGLGFAGALAEVGLPDGDIPLALLSFNIGIEIGQIAFIAAVFFLWHILKKLPITWPDPIKYIPSYGIGTLSVFWFLDRI